MSETVFVTGITGFIAKHVALNLLTQGYAVRGTLRSMARADEVRQTLQAHGADVSNLSFVEANLDEDGGWVEAVADCDYVQHIASPVPVSQPRDREALVPMARGGALRVLNAAQAADVKHIVVTSSLAAMAHRDDRSATRSITESDWSDPEGKHATAYIVSKTRAELAVWAWAYEQGWTERVTTVNPCYVLGPTLDTDISGSVMVVQLLMTGAYPLLPPINLMLVDVRDVAELHVRAMTLPETGGRRLLAAADTLALLDVADILRNEFPSYAVKIPTRNMPAFAVRLLAQFDRKVMSIVPQLGRTLTADNAYVTELTGVHFRPAEEAVRAAGQSLIDHSVI